MPTLHLIGGGRDCAPLYQRFIADCEGDRPRIATVVIDDGDGGGDGTRFVELLQSAGSCEPIPILVPLGATFDAARLDGMAGAFICGGLTPAYAAAISPVAAAIREWLAVERRVYAGFSAGAAIAARHALVGGWQLDGVPICHEDSAEDLEELSIVPGLGLTQFTVEVHCARWGTLSRLMAAVASGAVATGVGIDEDTMLTVTDEAATVTGAGRVWAVRVVGGALTVRVLTAGDCVEIGELSS